MRGTLKSRSGWFGFQVVDEGVNALCDDGGEPAIKAGEMLLTAEDVRERQEQHVHHAGADRVQHRAHGGDLGHHGVRVDRRPWGGPSCRRCRRASPVVGADGGGAFGGEASASAAVRVLSARSASNDIIQGSSATCSAPSKRISFRTSGIWSRMPSSFSYWA